MIPRGYSKVKRFKKPDAFEIVKIIILQCGGRIVIKPSPAFTPFRTDRHFHPERIVAVILQNLFAFVIKAAFMFDGVLQ